MALSTAESYRAAAREHLERADRLHSSEEFFLAHYVSGLAVECHLRAHLRLLTSEFDARHDLEKLAKEAEFTSIVPRNLEAAFSIKIRDAQSTLAQQPAVLHGAAVARLYDYDQSRVSSGRKSLEELESYDSKSCCNYSAVVPALM